MPERIQLRRTKGWKMPVNALKVDRSTRWGNPFSSTQQYIAMRTEPPIRLIKLHTPASLELCLDLFAAHLFTKLQDDPNFLEPLRGKNLACWCPIGSACHADVLLEIANLDR